jgi:predicted nucleotidyltransferase
MHVALYTPEERDEVAARLLELIRADERVERVELSGSGAHGYADRWSDVDIVVVAAEGVDHRKLADSWTARMYEVFPVVYDFRVSFGEEHVRGVLLENFLEVDLGFQPWAPDSEEEWTEWGVSPDSEAGLAWHDVLHAAVAIRRGRAWRAHYYIGLLRWRTLSLAGAEMSEHKGVDDVRPQLLEALQDALPRSLDPAELMRATRAVVPLFFAELRSYDTDEATHYAELADRLEPRLLAFLDEAA